MLRAMLAKCIKLTMCITLVKCIKLTMCITLVKCFALWEVEAREAMLLGAMGFDAEALPCPPLPSLARPRPPWRRPHE